MKNALRPLACAALAVVTGFFAACLARAADAPGPAAAPPFPATERAAMLAKFRADAEALTRALAESPYDPALYSRRGDRRLFLGEFAPAVADFEKMIALDPALDAPHWRLGIAYYFAGQFAKSARQFERYHAYESRDRENGLWKFLADHRVGGLARARGGMLVYTRFDREPFPTLYELFAGQRTTDEFFTDLKTRAVTADPAAMFFAHYYAGLHESLTGRRAEALALLHAAVASPWGRTAEGGPAYMWQVARLHYEILAKSAP
ncbi:MAG: Lipoprotein NlpI precursor [Verrucomicrobiota bacterium]